MERAQGWKEVTVMTPKVGEDRFILIEAEVLSDHFHRQHFRVRPSSRARYMIKKEDIAKS
jgi:hypothetical protein